MISKSIISKVLWSTIEDFSGLWEILWELNSLEIKRNRKSTAIIILKYLYKQNLIKFYFNRWGTDKLTEVDKQEVQNLFNKEQYWKAPNFGETCIKVGSTLKGEEYYNNDKIVDLKVL